MMMMMMMNGESIYIPVFA